MAAGRDGAALYDLAWVVQGASLALLYASPAAEPFGGALFASRTAEALAPQRGSLAAGLVFSLLGALALVGLATAGFGVWAFTEFRRVARAEAEGRAVGTGATDVACLAEAQQRGRAAPSILSLESSFLNACLEGASATEGFCDSVPAPHSEAADAWSEERCSRDADPVGSCASLMLELQEHCHGRDDQL